MAQKLKISPENVARAGQIVEKPDWYPVEVVNYEEKPASTDGSTNMVLQLKGIGKGVEGWIFYTQYNEKAPGFAIPFVVACTGKPVPKDGMDADLSKTVGAKIQAYIIKDSYQGRPQNKVVDFRPLTAAAKTA